MKLKFANALSLALIVAMLFTSVALADNVINNVTTGGTDTFTAPGSTTIGYRINATGGDDGPSGGGAGGNCNASDGTPATITLSVPAGVTASATSLTFTACNVFQSVTFSSITPGNYAISVSNIADTGAGSYSNQANFTLHVNAPPVTNTAPSLNLPSNLTAEATSASGALVSYTATASDTQDGSLTPTCSPASGSTFPLGPTTVNCSVTDSGGLSASGSFTVTVQDTTAPTVTAPANMTSYFHCLGE
jgi:hypothetical protein